MRGIVVLPKQLKLSFNKNKIFSCFPKKECVFVWYAVLLAHRPYSSHPTLYPIIYYLYLNFNASPRQRIHRLYRVGMC